VWDVADPTAPRRLNGPLTGHTVAFTPDGRTLASASDDEAVVLLWDVADRALWRLGNPLSGPASGVTSMVFAPDGRTLATASRDATAILWSLPDLLRVLKHPVAYACSLAGRGFDPGEWRQYVPGLDYEDSCAT
jgi:WD40 repeat protein